MSKTGNLLKFWMFLLLGFALTNSGAVFAQRGGFSPDRIFDFMDSDKNGRLDPNEIDNARGPFKEMLGRAGVDYRRGLDRNSFANAFEKIRAQREAEGGMRDSSDRGSDRSRDDERRRDESRRDSRGSDEERRRAEDEQRRQEYEKRRAEESRAKPPVMRPKERVTMEIPQVFMEGDRDGDGQIGFYEWKKWKRDAVSDFAKLDYNHDGFLTPRELAKGPKDESTISSIVASRSSLPPSAQTSSNMPIENPSLGNSGTTVNPAPAGIPAATSATPLSAAAPEVNLNSVAARRGESMFRLLDRDRDGQVAADEWDRSRTLKPLFEQGGVDLKQPMSKEDFLSNYIRLSGS